MEVKLKLKGTLLSNQTVLSIVKQGVENIKALENWEELKRDDELVVSTTKFIDKQVESLKPKLRKEINKRQLLIEIFKNAFELTQEDIREIEKILNFAINNKVIKKKGFFSKSVRWVLSWFINVQK